MYLIIMIFLEEPYVFSILHKMLKTIFMMEYVWMDDKYINFP